MVESAFLFVEQTVDVQSSPSLNIGVLLLDIQFVVDKQAVAYTADDDAPQLKRKERKDLEKTVNQLWDEYTQATEAELLPMDRVRGFIDQSIIKLTQLYENHTSIHFLSIGLEMYASVYQNPAVYEQFKPLIDRENRL